MPTCEDYGDMVACISHGCWWYNNSCHSKLPPGKCEDIHDQHTCEQVHCYWYNNSCHSSPPPTPSWKKWLPMLIAGGIILTALIVSRGEEE